MRDITSDNFGLVIAYLLPGFVVLWGLSFVSATLRTWLGTSSIFAPTVGGFLHVTLASLAAGLIVSTIRWAVIDTIHHRTGIEKPDWKFSLLQENFEAFEGLVRNHYRYYQFHANMFIAVAVTCAVFLLSVQTWDVGPKWWGIGVIVLEVILWFGSRDSLRKYYSRTRMLLNPDRQSKNSRRI